MREDIKELRYRTGLSQSEFARHYCIPVSTLRKWEQGESSPPEYVLMLLARQIQPDYERMQEIICNDGTLFYYDSVGKAFSDTKGNTIFVNEDMQAVKKENLPIYVQEMFVSLYLAQNKFTSDCDFDRKEDIIWG